MDRPTTIEVDLALMISKLDSPTASNAAKLLALEVNALREESERRNNAANAWNEKACELEREARKLRAELSETCVMLEAERETVRLLNYEVESHANWASDMLNKWGPDTVRILATLARVEQLCDAEAAAFVSRIDIDVVRSALRGGQR